MRQKLGFISLLVHDYDEAIDYFTHKLSFTLTEDTDLGLGKRFVVVHPMNGGDGTGIVLAKPIIKDQISCIGKQGADRVMFFLHTDDFQRDYHSMLEKGIEFLEEPRHEPYGSVVVFADLYGNRWDLVQPVG